MDIVVVVVVVVVVIAVPLVEVHVDVVKWLGCIMLRHQW